MEDSMFLKSVDYVNNNKVEDFYNYIDDIINSLENNKITNYDIEDIFFKMIAFLKIKKELHILGYTASLKTILESSYISINDKIILMKSIFERGMKE